MDAVRYGLVSAIRCMNMSLRVTRAAMRRRAGRGIGPTDLDGALVHVAVVSAVEMAVVEVVDVIAVANGEMAAICSVNVIVSGVNFVVHDLAFPVA